MEPYLTKPEFNIVEIPKGIITQVANWFLGPGSRKERLDKADVNMIYVGTGVKDSYNTVVEALQGGSPLFDTLAYFAITEGEKPVITTVPNCPADNTQDLLEVAQCLFVLYFYLMTRGAPPDNDKNEVGTDIPGFLYKYMGLKEAPIIYMRKLASFNLIKVSHEWIKDVDLTILGPPALSRLSLGVAGYRWMAVIGFMTPEKTLTIEQRNAWDAIANFVHRGLFWDIQSVTRSALVTLKLHSINAVAAYLLFVALEHDTLVKLHKEKFIPVVPEEPSRIPSLANITDDVFNEYNDHVFPPGLWTKVEAQIKKDIDTAVGEVTAIKGG